MQQIELKVKLISDWIEMLRDAPDNLRCKDKFSNDKGQFCAVGLVGYKLLSLSHPMSLYQVADALGMQHWQAVRISCLNDFYTFKEMAKILEDYLASRGEHLPTLPLKFMQVPTR